MSERGDEETLAERLEQYAGGCDNTRLYCPNVFQPECEQRMNEWLASLAATLRESIGALEGVMPSKELLCRADGLLSLIYHRYRYEKIPDDVREDMLQTSYALRAITDRLP